MALCLTAACLGACSSTPTGAPEQAAYSSGSQIDETIVVPLLGYYQGLLQLSATELQREHSSLVALSPSPIVQLRLAMVLGLPRPSIDLPRALALLEALLRAQDNIALSLHPLAKVLATQYQERLRLETQSDRLQQQLRECLRRSSGLQEKLDAIADIERALPLRPNADRHLPAGK